MYLTGRKLMVVAHPDDETLWGAGIILRNPGGWNVVACSTPVSDPVRAEKFMEACSRLWAVGTVLPCPDQYGTPLALDVALDADVIVTHGLAGEYGHPHHQQVARYVRDHAQCPVISFGYLTGARRLLLNEQESLGKLHALRAYDHVLPYEGRPMPKWQALLERYGEAWLDCETYDP